MFLWSVPGNRDTVVVETRKIAGWYHDNFCKRDTARSIDLNGNVEIIDADGCGDRTLVNGGLAMPLAYGLILSLYFVSHSAIILLKFK